MSALDQSRQAEPPRQALAGTRMSGAGPPIITITPWETLLDQASEAVLLVDGTGVPRAANRAARDLLPAARIGHLLPAALGNVLSTVVDESPVDLPPYRIRARRVDLGPAGTAWYLRDVTQDEARTDALLAERGRASFLADASHRLGGSLHRGRTARSTVALAVPVLADCAVVVMPPRHGRVELVRYTGSGPVTTTRVPVGRLREVPSVREALENALVTDDPRLVTELADADWLWGDARAPGSAMVLPMPGNGMSVGALVLLRGYDRGGFDAQETMLVREFAARAGLALAAATLYTEQVRTSSVLQASLEPPEVGDLSGAVVRAGYRPAHEALHIGGDFYDVLGERAESATVVLGDVSGKGVGAAVLTGQVRQALHALHQVEQRPLPLLHLLNRSMLATGNARFATLVMGRVTSLPGGGLRLRLAGGGHPPPLVLRGDGRVEEVSIGGMPAGIVDEAEFGEVDVQLAPGDLCLLYSDGVTEARGGPAGRQEFGQARLVDQLAACAGMPAGAVVERVEQLTVEWLDGRDHDDIALLGVQALPRGHRMAGSHALWPVPDPDGGAQ
jgi:serine phosphatase RsbU (regulator of sigma subunit)